MTDRNPRTPDGRYFVAKDRLWRCSDPSLPPDERQRHVNALMDARRAVKDAQSNAQLRSARAAVQAAKVALGERGPVWWEGDERDWTRFHPKNTPYAEWWEGRED